MVSKQSDLSLDVVTKVVGVDEEQLKQRMEPIISYYYLQWLESESVHKSLERNLVYFISHNVDRCRKERKAEEKEN